MINGFLLTRQTVNAHDGVQFDFWFSSNTGPLKVTINRQRIVFFIQQADVAQAENLLNSLLRFSIKHLELKNFEFKPMAGVYFLSLQTFYQARDILQKNNIRCFESDIRPAERFLSERFLTGPVTIHAETNHSNAIHSDAIETHIINPRLTPTNYQPAFKLMSLDIETDYLNDAIFSIAFVSHETKRVLMIDKQRTDIDTKYTIEYVHDEVTLLKRFLEWIEKIDPDIFIGWNVINFDFRFLQKKADQLNIPLTIGRQKSIPNWRQQTAESERYFLFIPGRIVLDGIDTLKSATYSFKSFSLGAVGVELLGRGKLISANNNHDPLHGAKEIKRQFYEDKISLAKYNLADCQLVWDIFEKTDLINFAIERARLTGLEMDRIGGSVAAFDNLYLPRLHRKGFIAPNIGDYEQQQGAPGGYVMNSIPGMHDSVLVLDYKSLYPSIIRTFKVDPYARIAALQEKNIKPIPGYDGASFSKSESILPGIIQRLWEARDNAKKNNNLALSQAIKIIMNSFYGVLGTPGCRVHDSRLTSSITKRSHDIILQTVQLIETAGYVVIYGDTDSVFVALGKPQDNALAQAIATGLIQTINQYWEKNLSKEYGIESYLEMEYETHFIKFFMPTIRGSEKGSKKRYAGLIEEPSGEQKLIFKGLETVRTDWTQLAKNFQQTLYQKIFNNEPYTDFIRHTVDELKAGKHDELLTYRKRLRKKLEKYQKNIPPHAQAAIKAEHFFSKNKLPTRYKNKRWIEYVITTNGPEALECKTSALNYEHYIEKQLTPIADTILVAMNTTMKSIIQNQYELF